jgi:hypothetical protein
MGVKISDAVERAVKRGDTATADRIRKWQEQVSKKSENFSIKFEKIRARIAKPRVEKLKAEPDLKDEDFSAARVLPRVGAEEVTSYKDIRRETRLREAKAVVERLQKEPPYGKKRPAKKKLPIPGWVKQPLEL